MILAGITTSLYTVLDNYVLKHPLQDPFLYAILGGWTGVIVTGFFGLLVGKMVAPKFKKKKELGLSTFGLPKEARRWVRLSGIAGGGFTLFYLIGQFFYDPDVVVPIS